MLGVQGGPPEGLGTATEGQSMYTLGTVRAMNLRLLYFRLYVVLTYKVYRTEIDTINKSSVLHDE